MQRALHPPISLFTFFSSYPHVRDTCEGVVWVCLSAPAGSQDIFLFPLLQVFWRCVFRCRELSLMMHSRGSRTSHWVTEWYGSNHFDGGSLLWPLLAWEAPCTYFHSIPSILTLGFLSFIDDSRRLCRQWVLARTNPRTDHLLHVNNRPQSSKRPC